MYYAININEYRQEDIPSLKRLWMETFGDAPELVDRFFELLPSMGTGLVAEADGELLGAAYLLDAELWSPEKPPVKLGYIYAVAVEALSRELSGELFCLCGALGLLKLRNALFH